MATLTANEAKPLIDQWRTKAAAFRKIAELHKASDTLWANRNKAVAEAYEDCANTLDQKFGRLS